MINDVMDVVARAMSQRDWEHSGHQEDEDFYLDMAEVMVRAYEDHVFRTTFEQRSQN